MNSVINNFLVNLNNIGKVFWQYSASAFIQSSVLIILLLVIDFILRKRVRAVFRYCVWMLVFIKLVLPPSFSLPTGIGYWWGGFDRVSTIHSIDDGRWTTEEGREKMDEGRVTSDETISVAASQIEPSEVMPEPAALAEPVVSRSLQRPPMVETPLSWQAVVFAVWLVGVLIFSVLLIQRVFFVRGLIAQSSPAESSLCEVLQQCQRQLGLRRDIQIRLSNNTSSPAVCGLFRPVILVPKTLLAKFSQDKLRAVLVHELAHIKRGDLWVNLVQTILQVIYFYNPFVWLANAIVRRIREQAVDEMVLVALGAEAKSYSNTLIDIAEMAFWRANFSLRLIGVAESKRALQGRIKHILTRPIPKSAKLGILGLVVIFIFAAVLLPMAAADKKVNVAETKSDSSAFLSSDIIDLVKRCLSDNYSILKFGDNSSPFYYEKGNGTAIYIIRKGAKYVKQQYDGIIWIMPADYPGRLLPLEGKFKQVGTPGLIGENKNFKIYCLSLPNDLRQKIIETIINVTSDEINKAKHSFRTTLPNGVTVELVGLGKNPWESEQEWWRPNGVEIEKPEFKANKPPHKWPTGPNGLQFECAALFKFSDFAGKNVSVPEVRFSNEFLESGMKSGIAADGTQITYIVYPPNEGVIPQVPQQADISLAIGTSPFKKAITPSSKFNEKMHETYILDDNSVVIRHPLRIDHYLGTLTVDLTCPEKDFEFQVTAELKNGQTERWAGGSVGKEVRFFHATPRRENIKVEDIKQLIIEYRPYEWVTFKNVSLQPGVKTDVQVETEGAKLISSQTVNESSLSAKSIDLQQLIDSAQNEATVIVPRGVYNEPVKINKALTLKGESRADCVFEVTANEPAIFIDTKGKARVTIEALTIKWQLATSERVEHPFALAVKDTKAEIKNCCFLPLGNFKRSPVAINSMGFSELTINTCRFEGFEFTVCFGEGTKGTIQDSLVMDSGHQGISLYSGANAQILRNVVTGSRYHGVRSTGGTLYMQDNLIIENANRGIYLGNKSAHGTVTNNVIMGNKIAGISGFAQSDVKILNNLILNSGDLGIGAQPSCRLFVKDNIIKDNPRGIVVFLREGDKRGNLRIRENTFWNNGTDTENCEKAPQSISEQPVFSDPNNGDFSLRPGPVLEQKQGLTNPEVFKALWKRWKNREDKNEPFTEKVLSMTAVQKTDVQVEVLKQIETITDVLIQAFNAGDIDTILSYYTDDVMSLPDQHEAAIGKGALHKLQLEAREEGVKIHSIKGLEQQIWDCGDFVFEAGRYVASMKSPKLRYLLSDWRKSVTVWARQPDGSLKIKLDSWNPDVIPDANVAPASPVVTVVASGSSSDSDMEAIYAQIKQKESTFHKAFIAHDAEAAIKFYADDAIIMSWGKDAIRGKADISSDIRKSMGEEPLVDMTQHVIHIEGNDKMLFAVNLFTWTFKDKSSGENVTLPGKGVHVWKRQQDGSWKILLDLHNPSVPIQQ